MAKNKKRDENQLLAKDFEMCRKNLDGIIVAPFKSENAKGIGYNFTSSWLVYSISRNKILTIHRNSSEAYIYLRPHETVLTLSHEYLKVSDNIAGTFHSRVRMNAKGIGSTSTTLDPNWKGMLLFSFNNPTRRKIKVVIEKIVNGIASPENMVTLVAEYINRSMKKDEEQIKLNVDNPAMRMDVWTELASKPHKMFQNRNYQKFRDIVTTLADFQSQENENFKYIYEMKKKLLNLRKAILAERSPAKIKSVLLSISLIPVSSEELKIKIMEVTKRLKDKELENKKFLRRCSKKKYLKKIELAERELEYQMLCDHVQQINNYIKENVPVHWELGWLGKIVYDLILPSLDGIVAGVLIFVVLAAGFRNGNPGSLWVTVLAAILPTIFSILFSVINHRHN